MAEPKDPSLPKMREWPMFRDAREGRRHRAKSALLDGRPLPRIADLVMKRLAGTPAEKLAWLRAQAAAGKLDGDDPDEVAQAEALLVMLVRLSAGPGGSEKRHLDELLDEGLRATFPASDPVAVGHFTSTEPPSRPVGRAVADAGSASRTVPAAGGRSGSARSGMRAAVSR
jgi:hypothetical protein